MPKDVPSSIFSTYTVAHAEFGCLEFTLKMNEERRDSSKCSHSIISLHAIHTFYAFLSIFSRSETPALGELAVLVGVSCILLSKGSDENLCKITIVDK